jgi:alkanesulfonate monooxygenase
MAMPAGIEIFSTCPYSASLPKEAYQERVRQVARWSDQLGYRGILVYTDNSVVDPWLVSQIILEETTALSPLVAVQPAYMHPYAAAKMVASFGYLYGRRVYLNMVAGGFKNDLEELNDTTPHDRRYARLIEYTLIMRKLLESPSPVTFDGEFYTVSKLKMTPPLAPELFPGIFVSGSSDAGVNAARTIGALAVKYPKPAKEYESGDRVEDLLSGVRVGVIARQRSGEAWEVARQRFPEDRKGQLTHQLAMKTTDSVWHKQLSQLAEETADRPTPYWMVPFLNYKTFCPYLVGDYDEVASELSRYIGVGYRTFIVDIPPNEDELQHTGLAFESASRMAAQ